MLASYYEVIIELLEFKLDVLFVITRTVVTFVVFDEFCCGISSVLFNVLLSTDCIEMFLDI